MKNTARLEIDTATEFPRAVAGEAVAICVFSDQSERPQSDASWLSKDSVLDGEFKGEEGTSYLLHTRDASGEERTVLFVGCGAQADLTPSVLSRAAGMAVRDSRASRVERLHFVLPPTDNTSRMARAAVEGAVMGMYDGDFYQEPDKDQTQLQSVTLVVPEIDGDINSEINRGRIEAESANWTRRLSDTPGRDLPPQEFAARAAEMANEFGLAVESLNATEIKERGMGGLHGVGKGSDEPPALIVIRYEPEGASPDDDLWAFIGKGITFDTGGISLKHGLDMYEMKADMAGGAAVLGAMRAIAQLKPRKRVVAIVPSAENMPSGRSLKPGDIVKTLAGKTIEVADTDAEGRLVLVDGIAYAKQLGAKRIVDLATLTGSIIVALGDHYAGLFSNDDEWANQVTAAGERAGESHWRMPVSDDYKKRIESAIADYRNYGGRPDATAAALLLSKFADGTPWVHLDIAGTAWHDDPQPYAPKGSSGAGVRTLVSLVCD